MNTKENKTNKTANKKNTKAETKAKNKNQKEKKIKKKHTIFPVMLETPTHKPQHTHYTENNIP